MEQRAATVTIRDVAREAGYSVTTVSRALNNYGDVSEATREHIRAVAGALDHHPNVLARGLQNNRANAVGLAIPLVLHRAHDPFWFDFIGGMAVVCAERGSDFLISASDDRDGDDRNFQRLLKGRRVDALLICDIRCTDPRIAVLQEYELPFVAFGRTIGERNYSYIDVDSEAGVIQAMEHLLRLGHRRVAYLGVLPEFAFAHFRLRGYRRARSALHGSAPGRSLTDVVVGHGVGLAWLLLVLRLFRRT